MKNYFRFIFIFIFLLSAFLFVSPQTVNAQVCQGTVQRVSSCKVNASGNCVEATWSQYNCGFSDNWCHASVQNAICGFKSNGTGGFTCQIIYGSPSYVNIPCAVPTPTPGAGGGTAAPTPTTNPCTTTCVDTEECKRADGCTTGVQGAYCGQTSTDNTPKYMCRTSSCTTVCPPTSTVTPTPVIPGTPTTITPSGPQACPLGPTVDVTFSWTPVANATSYYVRIDDTSNTWLANCGTASSPNPGDLCSGFITGTSYTIPLSANKNYQWFVSAYIGQVSGAASAWVPFSIPNICATPTPTPTAMCQNILAYSSNWSLLTNAQLTQTKAGDVLNYCVTGFTNSGTFDMARFTINGVLNPNTTLLRPGTTADYCQTYTVPTNTYNFNIVGEIHNTILGWVQ